MILSEHVINKDFALCFTLSICLFSALLPCFKQFNVSLIEQFKNRFLLLKATRIQSRSILWQEIFVVTDSIMVEKILCFIFDGYQIHQTFPPVRFN